jgi:predicted nucleotidyltransferase
VKPATTPAQPPISNDELQEIVARLKRALKPRRIWAFGSYARGDWSTGSDIDLMIEMETDLPPAQRRLEARRALGVTSCPVDVLVYTPEEVESRRNSLGSIIPTILREGIELR